MDAAWMQHGIMDAAWMQHGRNMDAAWMQDGRSMDARWMQHGCNTDATRMQHDLLELKNLVGGQCHLSNNTEPSWSQYVPVNAVRHALVSKQHISTKTY